MSKKYDYCVFIGRIQPPHKSHIENIRQGLEIAERLIIVLGSHRAARTIRNPWNASERETMIRLCLTDEENSRIDIKSVRDYYYNDNTWVANVQQIVRENIRVTQGMLPEQKQNYNIVLLGRNKDYTSYYLDLFPQWKREDIPVGRNSMNATDVRNEYFDKGGFNRDLLPAAVCQYLYEWAVKSDYAKLAEEWKFIQAYKKQWEIAPYPVTFVTTDAVLVKSGHVLMIRRKFNPGKGLLALPGGFAKQNISILDSALEELKEETRVKVPKDIILNHLKDERVFDHPNRSQRGRTITHAFYFELPAGGELPQVKGDDDAEHAMWIPLAELFTREEEIYEDHLHIINYFYSKPR
jgi:bifunctional NMN adenylyltransferase/nudix hydrolase